MRINWGLLGRSLFLIVVVAGCAPAFVQAPLTVDHPASPEGGQAPDRSSMNTLASEGSEGVIVSPQASEMAGMNHAAMGHGGMGDDTQMMEPGALPEAAVAPLKRLIESSTAIKNQLLAGELTGVAEEARALGMALDDLLKVEFPNNQDIWPQHKTEVSTIRGMALALSRLTDLNGARAAYGVLQGGIERLIEATGVPDGYEQSTEMDTNRRPGKEEEQHPGPGGLR